RAPCSHRVPRALADRGVPGPQRRVSQRPQRAVEVRPRRFGHHRQRVLPGASIQVDERQTGLYAPLINATAILSASGRGPLARAALRAADFLFVLRPLILVPAWAFYSLGAHSHRVTRAVEHTAVIQSAFWCLSGVLACAYVLNQIFDLESDRLNGK